MKNSADLGGCHPPRPLGSAEFFISYSLIQLVAKYRTAHFELDHGVVRTSKRCSLLISILKRLSKSSFIFTMGQCCTVLDYCIKFLSGK